MKIWRYGVAVGLLASLGACSNMMGGGSSASKSVATAPTVAPDMVKQVQSRLRDDGYYKQGSVDGVWGSGTETAVRSFQKDHNLGSSGQLDVPTLQALNVTNGTTVTGNPGPTQPSVVPTAPQSTGVQPNTPALDNSTTTPPR